MWYMSFDLKKKITILFFSFLSQHSSHCLDNSVERWPRSWFYLDIPESSPWWGSCLSWDIYGCWPWLAPSWRPAPCPEWGPAPWQSCSRASAFCPSWAGQPPTTRGHTALSRSSGRTGQTGRAARQRGPHPAQNLRRRTMQWEISKWSHSTGKSVHSLYPQYLSFQKVWWCHCESNIES